MLLLIPIIPILAGVAMLGGLTTMIWYFNQTKEKRENADRLALNWFGKRFKYLAEHQQLKIKEEIKRES